MEFYLTCNVIYKTYEYAEYARGETYDETTGPGAATIGAAATSGAANAL